MKIAYVCYIMKIKYLIGNLEVILTAKTNPPLQLSRKQLLHLQWLNHQKQKQ